jgi:cytochrome bd-type quinol oxidase subunit 2
MLPYFNHTLNNCASKSQSITVLMKHFLSFYFFLLFYKLYVFSIFLGQSWDIIG